jgi:hydrophobic/amphiphilic exporter-1 (mainly G- bacteria), HAE1 family
MFLSNLSIKRPVLATVMMLALLVLGIASYRRLPVDLFPSVEIPVISIVTLYPGASPDTVEREVSKAVEEAVNPIAGVRHVGSISRDGVSQVWVEFELEVDPDDAAQDARAKLGAIRGELPAAIEDPIIEKLDFAAAPVISLAVRSESVSLRELTTLVEKKVERRIENMSGVGKVDRVGPATREVQVEVDPARLEALGLGIDDLVAGLRSENVDTPLGRLARGGSERPLRVQGRARRVEELRALVVAQREGRPVRLGEVAEVRDGVEEQRSLALVDGVPAVALDVLKQTGANTVDVADAVQREIAALQAELPPGVSVEVVRDASVFIREAIADVQETLILGGLLTVLIVFCFLNSWRSTVITGLTLPISVVSSFIAMNFMGMTLNTMTLMALSLAIGLLIDDAIVVRENIVRHLQKGQDHFAAARDGTAEIGLAVLATTFSIVAVFVPVAFMKGIVGRFFFQFGITVAFAVLVSLFVSFTLDPMLSSRWVDPDIQRQGRRHRLARALDRFDRWFERAADRYRLLIGWALDHRRAVLAAATGAFVLGLAVFGVLEKEFFPVHDQGEFEVRFRTAPDASLEETRDRLQAVLAALRPMPEVERTYASVGAGDAGTVRDGAVYVKLVDPSLRRRTQQDLQRAARKSLAAIPGIVPSIAEAGRMDNRKPLLLSLRGEDLAELKRYASQLRDALHRIPGIVDLEMTLEHETPEYRLLVDRERAADAGFNTAALAGALAVLVGGQAVSTFEDEDGDAYDVRVRLPGPLREEPSQLEGLRFSRRGAGAPALVALGSVARHRLDTSPSEIRRTDLSREVEVSANLDGAALGTAVQRAREAAAELAMPPGYRLVVSGENEAMEESFGYMIEALVLAVLFVYLILAAQFESFVDPLAIMLSLPLSIVGMAGLLLLTGDTINMMSLIGLIMLMGLVTKNAILLVDFAKVLRGRGLDRRAALIEAGRIRLRPIVMTTAAMIFGMLPLALALGSGAEFRAPMARAIVGGLITSTVLTLIVVPVVYTLLDDFTSWLRARGRGRAHGRPRGATAALVVLALGAGPAAAGPPAKILTLEQALALAGERNRDVLIAESYRRWVNGKYLEERAGALPRFELGTSFLRQRDESQRGLYPAGFRDFLPLEYDVRGAEVRLSQPLFTWGQVGAAIRAAREGTRYADDQLRRFRQVVARDVSAAFYDVLAARELEQIAARTLELKRRHLEEARKKHQMGTATDYEVLAAEVAADNARPDAIRAENAARLARERLRFLLAEESEVDVEGALPVEVAPYPVFEATLQEALANRPELAELGHQQGVARELVTIAKAQDKPRFDLQAAWGRRWLGVTGTRTSGATWNLGVFVSFPFFDGYKTKGRVEQAQSDLARMSLEEAKAREAIALEVRAAVDAVREAGEIGRALFGTVAQAERVLFMAEQGYELGVKTRLDVEDAVVNLAAARAGLARAQRDYRVALVDLRRAAGTLPEAGR